ncbi:cytokine receptor-like factor 2 isoform X2 [Alexandromys fortis]|uniref:cytokine receptor-like factor 2 isoform X2 n=1 Tax=Alexandromys fortis TaxID=100897 RepID=UPI0021538216|nr:cytokine receptor-like factor 2 isoform X2 [Microtus fortis]
MPGPAGSIAVILLLQLQIRESAGEWGWAGGVLGARGVMWGPGRGRGDVREGAAAWYPLPGSDQARVADKAGDGKSRPRVQIDRWSLQLESPAPGAQTDRPGAQPRGAQSLPVPDVTRPRPPEDFTVVCRDLRDVEVTWDPAEHAGANLSLTWRYTSEPLRPCPRYFLSGGLTSGCVLPVRSGRPLEIDVRRGAEPVYHWKGLASAFLKPRPPDKLTLHWLDDAIHVTCPALPHIGLDYVIQHRGMGDTDWVASAPAPSCDVTVGGVDRSACLAFRVRAFPRESFYGGEVQPSDWSPVTQWRAGDAMGAGNDSCQAPPYSGFPKLQVACGLVTLLTSLLLLLALWRVKHSLLPWVPDPRGGFRGLFERHGGNFQAWIAQDVSPPPKPEAIDPTDPAEVALVLEHHGKGSAPDPALGSPGLPCQGPRDRDLVRVGGATFVMDGGSYMTL